MHFTDLLEEIFDELQRRGLISTQSEFSLYYMGSRAPTYLSTIRSRRSVGHRTLLHCALALRKADQLDLADVLFSSMGVHPS
jgi:hypothetical protein